MRAGWRTKVGIYQGICKTEVQGRCEERRMGAAVAERMGMSSVGLGADLSATRS